MLTIIGTESAKQVLDTPEGGIALPEEYFLTIKDSADNEYLLTVGVAAYNTVAELLANIKENQLSFKASA